MSTVYDGYARVVDILQAERGNLKELAILSRRDIFTFYRGADLVGVDLSMQDLRGLNFEGADIRFSDFSDASFDAGAFNGSITDDSQSWLKDEFDFYFYELLTHDNSSILLFCRLRQGLLEAIIREVSYSYREFSSSANVSEAALRKARRGEVIAVETAVNVLSAYSNLAESLSETGVSEFMDALQQPCIEMVSGGIHGDFKHITHTKYIDTIYKKKFIDEITEQTYPGQGPWRETVESIAWSYKFHSELSPEELSQP